MEFKYIVKKLNYFHPLHPGPTKKKKILDKGHLEKNHRGGTEWLKNVQHHSKLKNVN